MGDLSVNVYYFRRKLCLKVTK